jgi:type II secretory pathway pseudopilin PulG
MIYKKGAMFGLDARIALAIFGALSVISGAALYSAIQESKMTSTYQDMLEIGKANEAYYLDTGSQLPVKPSYPAELKVTNLVKNNDNEAGWSGPYLPYEDDTVRTFSLNYNKLGMALNVYFYQYRNGTWASDSSCLVNDCYEWILLDAETAAERDFNKNLYLYLDEKIDSGNGKDLGSIRALETTTYRQLYIKLKPRN